MSQWGGSTPPTSLYFEFENTADGKQVTQLSLNDRAAFVPTLPTASSHKENKKYWRSLDRSVDVASKSTIVSLNFRTPKWVARNDLCLRCRR